MRCSRRLLVALALVIAGPGASYAQAAAPSPGDQQTPSELVATAESSIARLLLCGRLYGARYSAEASRLEDALLDHIERGGGSLDVFGPPHQRRVIDLHDRLTDDRRNAAVERCESGLQDSGRALERLRGAAR